MKKLETFKGVVKLAVGVGVSTIVGNIIKESTSEETGAAKKLCVWLGGLVLIGMACDKASGYINERFDEVKNASKPVVDEVKQEEQKTA